VLGILIPFIPMPDMVLKINPYHHPPDIFQFKEIMILYKLSKYETELSVTLTQI
jgi:hypothetical protein